MQYKFRLAKVFILISRHARWTRHRDASQQKVPDLIGHPARQDDSQNRWHPITGRSLNITIHPSLHSILDGIWSHIFILTIYKNCSRFQNWRCKFECIFWIRIGRLWYCCFSWFNAENYLQYFVQGSDSFQLRNAETRPTRIFLFLTMQIIPKSFLFETPIFLIWRSQELSPN